MLTAFSDVARLADPANWNDTYQVLTGFSLYIWPVFMALVGVEVLAEKFRRL